MTENMRRTRDTLTGKVFAWNGTARLHTAQGAFVVPQRCTARSCHYLHPSRVPDRLLRDLNNGKGWEQ